MSDDSIPSAVARLGGRPVSDDDETMADCIQAAVASLRDEDRGTPLHLAAELEAVTVWLQRSPARLWDDRAQRSARGLRAELAAQLDRVDRARWLAASVPCAHPGCRLRAMPQTMGMHIDPVSGEPLSQWHDDGTPPMPQQDAAE